jgi:hypothetical protein
LQLGDDSFPKGWMAVRHNLNRRELEKKTLGQGTGAVLHGKGDPVDVLRLRPGKNDPRRADTNNTGECARALSAARPNMVETVGLPVVA